MFSPATLEADSIGKSFRGRKVLTSASLQANAASVTAVIGRMGAGKSTLLRICAGLVEPDSGWVRLAAVQYTRPRLHRLARGGLYFMGELSGLAESLTIRQHFAIVAQRFGVTLDEQLIEIFSLSPFMERKPHRLSTGERRRAELALAISRRPRCFIADEPFRELDPVTCELLGSGIKRLASNGCAVIVSGHEIHTIFEYADCVTWVTAGTTYQLGTRDQATRDERLVREFLGPTALRKQQQSELP